MSSGEFPDYGQEGYAPDASGYGSYSANTYYSDDPWRDHKKDNLALAEQHAQIGEGKYLCARCGFYSCHVECRTCRRNYCQACSDFLHSHGEYRDHELRVFDADYEANKRAVKRGTKFDSNAPAPAVLSPGEALSTMPGQSKIVLLLALGIMLLGIASVATSGWTYCNQTKTVVVAGVEREPLWNVGPWRSCWDDRCEGTLYFWEPLDCPYTQFKTPVNFTRAWMACGLFFTLVGIILVILGQKAIWHALVLLKSGAVCMFLASVFYLFAVSFWMAAVLQDRLCHNALVPQMVYGPMVGSGHCYFSYGFYMAWGCVLLSFVAGFTLFDWWHGLPALAKISILILFIVQGLCVASLVSNYWFQGDRGITQAVTTAVNTVTSAANAAVTPGVSTPATLVNTAASASTVGGNNNNAWGGLWRHCGDVPAPLEYLCNPIGADWLIPGYGGCFSEMKYKVMRGLMIFAMVISPLLYAAIFYAHAFRKPKVTKFLGSVTALIMFICLLVVIIMYAIEKDAKHTCSANGATYDKLPYCTNCKLGWSWILALIACLLSLVLVPLFFKMRVGFERDRHLDASDRSSMRQPKPGASGPGYYA